MPSEPRRDQPNDTASGGRSRFGAAFHRSTRALRTVNFRWYFGGQTLSYIGTWMQVLAQTWLVLRLTDRATSLAVAVVLQTLPMLFLGPWAGAIADRIDNRRIIVVGSVVSALAATTLGTLVATDHVTVGAIWACAFVLGAAQAFERPAGQALLYELVGPDDLPSAVGLNATLNATSRLAGPALAAVAISAFGLSACFFANAVSFLVVVVAIAMIRRTALHPRRAAGRPARIRDGLTYAWRTPALRWGLLAMAITGTLTYNYVQTVPSMVRFVFHAGPGGLGLVETFGGLGSVIGGFAVASLVNPTARRVGVAAVVYGALIVLAAATPSVGWFAASWLVCGLASAVYLASMQSLLQRSAAPEFQGRVMALFSIAFIGTTPIGALILGPVIDHWSARAGLGIAAVAAALAGILLVATRRASGAPGATGEVVVPT